MTHPTHNTMEAALRALADMIRRGEQAQAKFAPGTAQHTLQRNRIHALYVAAALIRAEAGEGSGASGYTREELERATAPLLSLLSKSEKAQQKLTPDSWQHRMLAGNLRALRLAMPLLERALTP